VQDVSEQQTPTESAISGLVQHEYPPPSEQQLWGAGGVGGTGEDGLPTSDHH